MKICSKFTGEQPCQSVITLPHRYFPVNLLRILRTPFCKNTYGGLLLYPLTHFLQLVSFYISWGFQGVWKENITLKHNLITNTALYLFQPNVAYHIETSHLFCSAKQIKYEIKSNKLFTGGCKNISLSSFGSIYWLNILRYYLIII